LADGRFKDYSKRRERTETGFQILSKRGGGKRQFDRNFREEDRKKGFQIYRNHGSTHRTCTTPFTVLVKWELSECKGPKLNKTTISMRRRNTKRNNAIRKDHYTPNVG